MAIGLDEYTFQLDDDGVTLNDDGSPFVDIIKVEGLDSAPFRETIRDHEGADGSFIDAEFERGRDIILDGIVYCDTSTIENYLDSLKANFAPVQTPIPFYLKAPGVDERVLFVKSRGIRYSWDTARRIGVTNIQFLLFAEDPRLYDATLQSTNFAFGGESGIGLGFSFGFNVDFGGGASPAGGNVTNSGNRSTPVEFVVNGPVENPIIYNNTTGDSLAFFISLGATDTLTINTRDRTVYLNGNINRRNTLLTPNWFFLEPGINNISYGGLSGIGSSLDISFRSAWR